MAYCENCGTQLEPDAGFCAACGAEAFGERATGESQANGVSRAGDATALAAGQDGRPMLLRDRMAAAGITPGFSERMETDEFQTAMKKANRTHVIVLAATAVLLAPLLVAIVSVIKPSNVGALVGAGVIVEAIIIGIIVYMLAKRFAGKTWDGRVTGKRVSRERSGNSTRRVFITEFTTDDGRRKKHKERTLHPTYDYLNVGDRVRYHPQLSYPFEKYDKTTDGLLLCPFCGDFQEIENDSCSRCKNRCSSEHAGENTAVSGLGSPCGNGSGRGKGAIMKRGIALFAATMMCACCLGLAACGGSSGSSSAATPGSASASGSASAAASSEAASSASGSSASDSPATEGSQVKALWSTIDSKGGVHMAYGETNESMGSEATVDAQAKDSSYYSKETITVKGYTDTKITAMIDGVAMNLDVDAKTGTVATTTTSQVAKDPMLMDDVYKALWTCAKLSPSSIEKGAMDGATYTVETYEQQYTADDMFYFDDEGNLAYYVQGSMKSGSTEIGETVYKINAIDAAVDESLFDVSGYTIEGR